MTVLDSSAAIDYLLGDGDLGEDRARAAVEGLGDIAVDLFPSMPLRARAFALRADMTVGDALFVALAERLAEPLATKDAGLARAAADRTGIEVVLLESPAAQR